ncbi:MAG: type II secretion system major pseudopilin GspG [Deferribacteraceae bacterium]|nr:type II secretion system major pseudopilin GspG [Deferribacteraceae bacterium]
MKRIGAGGEIFAGFTLIEVMVVLVIIGILAVAVAPRILSRTDQANVTKAKTDMRTISSALKLYKLDNGNYPTTEQGLEALVALPTTEPVPQSWSPGGYIEGGVTPRDPWGNSYIYRSPGDNGADFEIISLGKDMREGGTSYDEDIIVSG